MFQYILKRLAMACVTLFVIMLVSYMLIRLAPGDPTTSSFFGGDQGAANAMSTDKGAFQKDNSLRKKLHLDESPFIGFAYWLKDAWVHGDLGDSASVDKGCPIVDLIMERLSVTIFLFFLYSLMDAWDALLLQATICDGGWFPIFPLKGLTPATT